MTQLIKKLIYTFTVLLFTHGLFAQSLDQAKKLYNEGKYEEAKPAFERLVKRTPSNASYNHWYGVCCFETADYKNAEKHLLVASKRNVQESYRYLGELYIITYNFEEAQNMFREYITLLSKKKQDVSKFEARVLLAEKAQRMLDKVEDVQVIDSLVVDKGDFLEAYKLSEESGSLTSFRDFFESEEDVKSIVYMNQKGDNIYYAHPDENNNYAIYRQTKLIDKWGDEKKLPSNINGNGNTNYPFVMSDGVTIYYASNTNNSIGGYDLYVTRYNINSETYLTPEQLGMPYNSIYNDYMMVIDEGKKLGWFVSDRYQPEDKVCIYLFIPNDNRSRIENEDIATKRARAMLTSISTTWKEGSNYAPFIELAYQEVKGEPEIEKEFEFIINNNIVYYNLDDIQSSEARGYYEKALDIHREINQLNEKLDGLRVEYTESNKTNRQKLTPQILKLEEQVYNLLGQPEPLEKRARNAEINYLRLNR